MPEYALIWIVYVYSTHHNTCSHVCCYVCTCACHHIWSNSGTAGSKISSSLENGAAHVRTCTTMQFPMGTYSVCDNDLQDGADGDKDVADDDPDEPQVEERH